MQFKHHRRHKVPIAESAEAESFGDLITGDHIVTVEKMDKSVDGKRDAVVLYDVATHYLAQSQLMKPFKLCKTSLGRKVL